MTPSVELGLRHDGGDGITGGGIEIGGGLGYRDLAAGLTIEGNGRVMTGQGDYREWGLGGSLRLDPGADGRGVSLSLAPTWTPLFTSPILPCCDSLRRFGSRGY